jgi:hypothetical protein
VSLACVWSRVLSPRTVLTAALLVWVWQPCLAAYPCLIWPEATRVLTTVLALVGFSSLM